MHPKDVEGISNSVDPDQTAPGSALFALTCLSENLGKLCEEPKQKHCLGMVSKRKLGGGAYWQFFLVS